ncbi:HAMP domain-containing histidine kinase [Stenotrophomonas maltophilia]|uniref:sensor histidine kinase n=1 Tax=Stenotrophomonas sp. RAC2 TaxID=3064902 RepID=UPI0018D2FBDC|nr:HAMP domain-containing sensor histidine kinase [Stenotrophomonas sp. RAC2]MBH1431669.1 HAMP domain-containing histidine kinase [Stenotrophomonas maltophilia]MDV9043741.1 HAMP domain-containing sensor histidine kinase [Stenotrophomonas sp. RAC2]
MTPAGLYRRLTLRTRITISFVLLMAGAMGFIVLAEQVDYDQVRAVVVARTQASEVRRLQDELARGQRPALPSGSALYDARNVPVVLRQYGLGYHGEQAPNEWHLRVFDSGGQRYYLLQDAAPYGYLEHLINAFAALVISICVLGAFLIGRRVASHVIAPITQLADAVQSGQKPFPCQDARDEIGVLARAFARHSDELERFLHREQCFSGDASHELRTPLAIIGGAAETLACQLPADSHLVPSAERILRTTQEMQRQLSCLLLLSRAPDAVPRNKVALRPLIESCMERCQPWLSDKPVSITFDARNDAVLDTHADLAHSVIWNLLRNACQYTERGDVRVTLRDTALIVADTGPGLPSSIDPEQFQRFLPCSPHSGEGLGLSIVQRIVEHLGWRMTVHSSQQGCRFTLEWSL